MQPLHQIEAILKKHLEGELTEAEQQQLQQWLQQSPANQALFNKINDPDYLPAQLEKMEAFDEDRVWQKIEQATASAPVPVKHMPLWRRSIGWAAAILLLILAGAGYWQVQQNNQQKKIAQTQQHKGLDKQVLPGREGAILTLSDGRQVLLDSVKQGMLATQRSTKVMVQDGRLVYKDGSRHDERAAATVSNTITTTKGRYYQMILPDGSGVWLNAASSITYPVTFTGTSREVSITGEVYFEVAKDKSKPFRVTTNDVQVEVLGTHFNINGYTNERNTSITLLEGSVRVNGNTAGDPAALVLKPGQQARFGDHGSVELVPKADIDEVMAWKNGTFSYQDADIQTVMRQMERWYDIEVKFEGRIPSDRFTGKVPRSANLSQVLRILKLSDVNIRMDGKTLTISPSGN